MEETAQNLLDILENETTILLEWFKFNEMKSNEDKCHLLIINHQDEICVKFGNENIVGSSSVDLLGIKIDNNLNFIEHVSKLIKKRESKITCISTHFEILK